MLSEKVVRLQKTKKEAGQKKKFTSLRKFARKLIKLRKKSGKTQATVTKELGVYINRMELGTENPKLTTLIRIAQYYNVSLSELLDDL